VDQTALQSLAAVGLLLVLADPVSLLLAGRCAATDAGSGRLYGPCFSCIFAGILWERHLYRKNSYPGVVKKLELEENSLFFADGSQIKLEEMRWYRTKGEQAWLFLKGCRFLWVDMAEWSEKKKELFRMKLTQRGLLAGHFWKLPVAVCLAAITLLGCAGVAWTAVPYNGKLSWKIDEWRYPEKWQQPEKNEKSVYLFIRIYNTIDLRKKKGDFYETENGIFSFDAWSWPELGTSGRLREKRRRSRKSF